VRFVYGAVTHCGRPFQNRSTTQQLGNSVTTAQLGEKLISQNQERSKDPNRKFHNQRVMHKSRGNTEGFTRPQNHDNLVWGEVTNLEFR
jgi:hypothetical protein